MCRSSTRSKLQAARTRALDDTGYDAGPTEVLARMYELLAAPGLPASTPTTYRSARPRATTTRRVVGWSVALFIVLGIVAWSASGW